MKVKQVGIVAFLLLVAVLAYLALKRGRAEVDKKNGPGLVRTSSDTNVADSAKDINNKTNNGSPSHFNYIKEEVANGTLRGVVEVGAAGFNSFVINVDKQKHWEIVSKDYGKSLVYEGLATTEQIRAGLTKYQ